MSRTISAGTASVTLATGDDPVLVTAAGSVSGGLYGGTTANWTITNFGFLGNTANGSTINDRTAGAAVRLRSASTITNATTTTGTIQATGSFGVGVLLQAGGTVSNQGLIAATGVFGYGIVLSNGGSVINSGTISVGSKGDGISLSSGGSVTNSGSITGNYGVAGASGYLSNASTGYIGGGYIGVYGRSPGGATGLTVNNAGTLSGYYGVFDNGGSIYNAPGGVISGNLAVESYGGNTLQNAGTIESTLGAAGTAVAFVSAAGRLIVDPGAVFTGTVDGGPSSTLELSGTGGGTLSGLGSEYINFAKVTIDAGATWTLAGTNSVAAGVAVTNAGTFIDAFSLTNGGTLSGGVTLAAGVTLNNVSGGTITTASGTAVYAAYPGDGSTAGVVNSGKIAGSTYGIYLASDGYISNASAGALIDGQTPIQIGRTGTVVNHGTIGNAADLQGILIQRHGSVTNVGTSATIASNNTAIYLNTGGAVTNGVSAVISGGDMGVFARQAFATITNAGTIHSHSFAGIELQSGGAVTNQAGGVISSQIYIGAFFVSSVSFPGAVTLTNFGSIAGGPGHDAVLLPAGNTGRLIIEPGAVFTGNVDGGNTIGGTSISTMELASGASAGTLSGLGSKYIDFAEVAIDAGATWDFTGTNTIATGVTLGGAGTIENDGVIVLDPSRMKAALTGTGSVTIGSGSTLEVFGTVAAGQTIVMTGTNDFQQIDAGTGFAGTITGFVATDVIDVEGIGLAQSARIGNSPNTHALYLHSGASGSGAQLFSFPYITSITGGEGAVAQGLTFSADTNNGTLIACYLRGTRIRTSSGEVAIEFLSAGDLVETLTGPAPIRWIGRRRYVLAETEGHAAVLPVLIRAGAIGDGLPRRDLCVSPEHALCIDGVLVPARHLTNGNSIVQRHDLEVIEYFHLELAEHAVIFAEGMPAETFVDCDSRKIFDNVASFTGGGAPEWRFCAPRVEEGQALEEIRARINARAGIVHASGVGPLIGRLERVTDGSIEGWAQDAHVPERPVWLEIIADGAVVASVLANRYRNDLEAAGLGSGRHAFRAAFAGQPGRVEARRIEDGALLGALSSGARSPCLRKAAG